MIKNKITLEGLHYQVIKLKKRIMILENREFRRKKNAKEQESAP